MMLKGSWYLLLSLYAVHSTRWSFATRQIPAVQMTPVLGDIAKVWIPGRLDSGGSFRSLGDRWAEIKAGLRRSGLGCRNRCARNTCNELCWCGIYVCRRKLLDRQNIVSGRPMNNRTPVHKRPLRDGPKSFCCPRISDRIREPQVSLTLGNKEGSHRFLNRTRCHFRAQEG